MRPRIYLIRHGETEWSLASRHTSRTDIPLTEQGEQEARKLAERLRDFTVQPGVHQFATARAANL